MFARFDENPAMTLRVIKETKRYGRTDGRTDGRTHGRTDARTDGRTDNVKTVYPLQTKFAGGIITQYEKLFRHLQEQAQNPLTLNAPIATKVICFSCLLKCLRSLYGKQCGPRSDCSYRSSLFWVLYASILNLSVMLGNYLQQTTSADDIFRCIFFLAL